MYSQSVIFKIYCYQVQHDRHGQNSLERFSLNSLAFLATVSLGVLINFYRVVTKVDTARFHSNLNVHSCLTKPWSTSIELNTRHFCFMSIPFVESQYDKDTQVR
jgi:hypothetical protein